MTAPFEGVFGDTSELRVIQFLLPLKDLEFNISELARGTGISRQTMVSVMRKLAKWNVLKLTNRHGNANYYAINEDSGFVEAFESLNNCIVEQILGEEELGSIANYAHEHAKIPISEVPQKSYAKDWASDRQESVWMRFVPTESPGITAFTTQKDTPRNYQSASA
jgi:hypothetical protein